MHRNYKKMTAYIYDKTVHDYKQIEVTNAHIMGEMADGTPCWEFDGFDPDGFYFAFKKGGKLYIVQQ